MTILITGANGYLGSLITERLLETSARVRGMKRPGEDVPALLHGSEWVEATLEDAPSLSRACDGVETIVHCAAVTHTNDGKLYYQVNFEGTKNLLRAAPKTLKHFIYISTTALGKEAGAYGHSKWLAEQALKQSEFPYTIIRPSEVYGASNVEFTLSSTAVEDRVNSKRYAQLHEPRKTKEGMIEKLAAFVKKMPVVPLVGNGSTELAPVFVDDVIDAIVRAALLPAKNETYILAGPERISYKDLLRMLCEAQGIKNRIFIPVPAVVWRIVAELAARIFKNPPILRDQIPRLLAIKNYNIRAAQQDLSFQPRPLRTTLKKTT